MIQSGLTIAQAEANRLGAESIYYPGISVSGGYTAGTTSIANVPNSASRTNGANYNISASQSIFTWGANKASVDISKLSVKIAQKQYADAYRQLAVSVRNQYLAVIVSKVYLRNAKMAEKRAKDVLTNEEDKLKEGRISEGDIIGPRLNVEDSAIIAERAAVELEHNKRVLINLSGISELPDEEIPESIKSPNFNAEAPRKLFEQFQLEGAENTYQGQVYRYQIEQARLNYHIARTGLLPKFSIGGTAGVSNASSFTNTTVATVSQKNESVSISGGWTIFNGFATRAAKLSALASKRLSERALKTYVDATIEQARYLQTNLMISARQMSLSNTREALSKSAVSRVKEDFDYGVASQTMLNDVMLEAAGAELRAASARQDFLNRWVDFLSTISADPALNNVSASYLTRDAK